MFQSLDAAAFRKLPLHNLPTHFTVALCPGLPGSAPAFWVLTRLLCIPSQIRSTEQQHLFCFLSLGIHFKVPPTAKCVLPVSLLLAFATQTCSPLHPHNLLLFSFVVCSSRSSSSPPCLRGLASLLSPGWNLFIMLPQPEKMPIFPHS